MPTVKAVFELEMEEDYYQFVLEWIEKNGSYTFPVNKGVTVRKPEWGGQ